jgi:hypothetical protein
MFFRKNRKVITENGKAETFSSIGVPAYALIVQSALHTEPRYTVGIWYFLLIFAGVAVGYASEWLAAARRTLAAKTPNSF